MSPDKLVYMANQIGRFFASQREDQVVAGITDHLQKYWDPRMRATILDYLARGGSGFDPLVRDAVEQLGKVASEDLKPACARDEVQGSNSCLRAMVPVRATRDAAVIFDQAADGSGRAYVSREIVISFKSLSFQGFGSTAGNAALQQKRLPKAIALVA